MVATTSVAAVDQLAFADERIGPSGGREPTRYLCAMAHLRPDWRDSVLTDPLTQPCAASAPHTGLDLGAVLAHCIWAADRELRFAVAMWLSLAGLLLSMVTFDIPFFCIFTVGGLAIALGHHWRTRNILTQQLKQETFNPSQTTLRLSSRDQQRLSMLLTRQSDNVVVYKEFSPFVGSGHLSGRWMLQVDTSKPKEEPGREGTVESFRTVDLYKHVKQAILGLQLPEVSVEDR